MAQLPVVIGLKVCKDVIIDKSTGHVTPVNCVHKLRVKETPTRPEDFTVGCVLTDGLGETTFTLYVTQLLTKEDIITRSWRLPMKKTLSEKWLLMKLKDLVFPAPGRYEFLLLANGQWCASCTITVIAELKGESL